MVKRVSEASERLQLQSLTAQDVRIDVPMGDIGTADFERTSETVALGVAAARAVAPQIARYAVPPQEYLAWRSKVTSDQGIESQVDTIEFAKLKRVNPQYLNQISGIKPGDKVTTQSLSQSAQRMAAVQDIDSVSYELTGDPAHATLQWLPYEKSWAPDYIKVDLGMYASTSGDDRSFALYFQHDRTWINSLGAQWRNEIQFGTNQFLSTSFYQPLDIAQRFFVEPKAFWNQSWENVFYDGNDVARYQFNDLGARLDFGVNIGNVAQLRVGYLETQRRAEVETGSPLLPQLDLRDAGIVASALFDTRDTPFGASRGMVAAFEYLKSDTAFGAQRDWQRAELGIGMAVPFHNDIVRLALAGGSNLGSNLPADRLFTLGGPVSLAGEELDALRAAGYWTISASYLWQIKDIFALRGQALYAGVRLQDLESFETIDDNNHGQIGSVSVFITGRTPVGPLTVGVAATTADAYTLWVSFGRPIAEGSILSQGIFR
jgi:NTE family protein